MNFTKIFGTASLCACAAVLVAGCGDKNVAAEKAEAADGAEAEVAEEVVAGADDEALAAPEFKADDVLVDVDGDKFTYGDAEKIVKRMLKAQGAPAEQIDMIAKSYASQMLPRLADQYIGMAVLKAEALKRGFKAGEADIAGVISNMTAQLPEGKTIEAALEDMGVTLDEVRKEVAESFPITKLIEDVTKSIAVADEEVEKFFKDNPKYFEKPGMPEQVEASHILIKVDSMTNETDKATAKAKCEELRKRVLAGEDFAALAKENSDCPSKSNGGSLGYFGKGQMVAPFEKAAFALETNQVSEVVETQFGYHIIKVTGKKAATPAVMSTLDEVREDIAKFLANKQKGEIVDNLVEDLKAKAKVVRNKALDSLAAPVFPMMGGEELEEQIEEVPASEPVEVAPADATAPAEAK